ncbi:MAG: ANTAR domain-containing protein [Stagnimonas sp.]|nr:ANTAR domain-containing protein [Stagnimonas sp.]
MRVMLVDDDAHRSEILAGALKSTGHHVVAHCRTVDDLLAATRAAKPDIVLIDVDSPGRDMLESLAQINLNDPMPVALFAAKSDVESIRRAMRAGVCAYVVDGLTPTRLQPVMEVAIARFAEYQALKRELDDTKSRLSDRKDIDRAKGLLMARRNLTEEQAYEQLRKAAMNRNLKIGDAARAVIAAADLL